MALILSIETSTTVCSAALHDNGKLIASKELLTPQSASSQLALIINDLIIDLSISAKDIKAVAVASGPGSYTGLRIGVATAKGFCFALKIPLIAINTLALMAYQLKYSTPSPFSPSPLLANPSAWERGLGGEVSNVLLCPMLDARRMEVYCLLADSDLNSVEATQAKIINQESFKEWLDKHIIFFFGNGADKCKDLLNHANARFIDKINPTAAKLGEMAFKKFEKNEFENLSSFEPHYLKEFLVKKPKTT